MTDKSDLDFAEVLDHMYSLAESVGRELPQSAWLEICGVYWPNPHYTGKPVPHPECDKTFHPEKRPTQRERFLAQREKNKK